MDNRKFVQKTLTKEGLSNIQVYYCEPDRSLYRFHFFFAGGLLDIMKSYQEKSIYSIVWESTRGLAILHWAYESMALPGENDGTYRDFLAKVSEKIRGNYSLGDFSVARDESIALVEFSINMADKKPLSEVMKISKSAYRVAFYILQNEEVEYWPLAVSLTSLLNHLLFVLQEIRWFNPDDTIFYDSVYKAISTLERYIKTIKTTYNYGDN